MHARKLKELLNEALSALIETRVFIKILCQPFELLKSRDLGEVVMITWLANKTVKAESSRLLVLPFTYAMKLKGKHF